MMSDEEARSTKSMVRLPADVKEWLDREAARNFSSMNSEIVRSVRARMEREREKAVA